MKIKLLPKSLRENLRSDVIINSTVHCISQLVLNSLEAKSSSIAVRVNLTTQKLQVIDNGLGISKKNLKLIGHRYATSKYYSSKEMENNFKIGVNRGEALASIINLSKNVKITSRSIDTKKTYHKIFEEGKSLSVNLTKERPSKGVTVEIQMFLYNRPVRKKCLNNTFLLEEIKQELENFALIYPKVSISLRNDSTGEIIFRTYHTKFVFQTVSFLYGKEFSKMFRKLSFSKNKISLNGIISIKPQVQNKFQYVYINYRHIKKCKIHSSIISLISKSKILNKDFADSKEKYSAFIINLKCSYSEIDILDYFDLKIEFKDWDKIISFVETGVTLFLQKQNLLEVKEKSEKDFLKGAPISQKLPSIHMSQFFGVIKGISKKRKCITEEIEEEKVSQKSGSSKKSKCVSLPKSIPEEPVLKVVEHRTVNLPKNLLMWSSSISHNSNCNKLVDNQIIASPPKQSEISQIKQTVLKPLNGKQLIMNMFLKSTAIFTADKDLINELLKTKPMIEVSEKQGSSILSNKGTTSISRNTFCALNNQNSIPPNNQEFKLSFRSSVFNNNNCKDEVIFKKPFPIHEKKSSKQINKKNNYNDNILCKKLLPVTEKNSLYHINQKLDHKLQYNTNKISQNILSKFYCEKKPFYKLFFHKLCSQISKNSLQNNLVNNYRYSIKHLRVSKKLNYVRSSDFLKPGLELSQKTTEYENIPKKINSNDLLKTWFDTKYKPLNRKTSNQIFLEPQKYNFTENQTSILTPIEMNKVTKFNFNFTSDKTNFLPQFSKEFISEKPVPLFSTKTNLQKHIKNMNIYTEQYHDRYNDKYDFQNNIDNYDLQNTTAKLNEQNKYSENIPSSQFFAKTQITYNSHKHASTKQLQSKTKFKKPLSNTSKNILPNQFKTNSKLISFNFENKSNKNTNKDDKLNIIPFSNKNIKSGQNFSNYKPNINHANQAIDETITNTNLNRPVTKNIQTFLQGFHRLPKTKNPEKIDEFNIKPTCERIIELNKNTSENQNLDQISNNFNISAQNGSQFCNNIMGTTEDNQDCSISKISSLERLLKTQNIDITPFCSENVKLNLTIDTNNLEKGKFGLFQNTTRQENIESASNKSKMFNFSNGQKIHNKSMSQIEAHLDKSISDKQKESETQNTTKKYCFTESEENTKYLIEKMMQVKDENMLNEQKLHHIQKWVDDNKIYLEVNKNNKINSETNNISETKSGQNLKKSSNSLYEKTQYLNEWFENNEKYFNSTPSIVMVVNNSETSKAKTIRTMSSNTNLNNKNNTRYFTSQSLFSNKSNKIDVSLVKEKNLRKIEIDVNKTANYKKPEELQNMINNITENMSDKVEDNNEKESANQSIYDLPVNRDEVKDCEVNETKYTNDLDLSSLKLNNEKTILTNLNCAEEPNNHLNDQTIEEIEISVNPKDILNLNKSSNSYFKSFNLSKEKLKCIEEKDSNENVRNKTLEVMDVSVNSDYKFTANESTDSYFKNVNSSELVKEFEKIEKKNVLLETTKDNTMEKTHKFAFNFKDPIYSSSSSNISAINRIISQEFNLINCNNKNNEQITSNTAFNFNPSYLSIFKNAPASPFDGIKTSEWMHQEPENGNSYYLNSRTGMTSFLSPREVEGCCMTKRYSFMPKGMSPILLNTSKMVESKELSPNSKNILHKTLANSDDELKTVKWMKYLQNNDSEKFFTDLYSQKKYFEFEIPNASAYTLPKKVSAVLQNHTFTKNCLQNVTVLNQWDSKFIVTKYCLNNSELLVLFDQHAVHERIRLEKLLKDYSETEDRLKSIKCKYPLCITLEKSQIKMLETYKKHFENWGVYFEINGDKIKVTRIPLCWKTKDDSNDKIKDESIIKSLIVTLIEEEYVWLKSFPKINIALPMIILDTIKMEACRSAIKFGEFLTIDHCKRLLHELSFCDLPFQCAHGRPTLVPLLDLKNLYHDQQEQKTNLSSLRQQLSVKS